MDTKPGAGKGSKPRPFSNYEDYSSNWDEINWSKKKDKNNGKSEDNSPKDGENTGGN